MRLQLIKPWDAIKSIKQVIIKNGVTSIGNYAFSGCYNLTSIEIPDTVTHIEKRHFMSVIIWKK